MAPAGQRAADRNAKAMLRRTMFDEDEERRRDLRDWYAGLAMQSMLGSFKGDFPLEVDLLSDRAFEIADAMIVERDCRDDL